jgi:hypothetical protein
MHYVLNVPGLIQHMFDGKIHREDGPALILDMGIDIWYQNGKIHRENGPAIEFKNGDKKWFLQDREYTEKDYWRMVKLKALW